MDTTFDETLPSGFEVHDLIIQPSTNKIVVGGGGATVHDGLYRLESTGIPDTTFNVGGTGITGAWQEEHIYDVELYNGTSDMIITGKFAAYNGVAKSGIARINANGTLNTSVNFPAITNNTAYDAAVQTDGKIVVVGMANGQIARYTASGATDTSFTPIAGTATPHQINVVKIQTDGKILIGGDFTQLATKNRRSIARLMADGSLDECFDPGYALSNTTTAGVGTSAEIIIEGDNLIVGGNFSYYDGTQRSSIAKARIKTTINAVVDTGSAVSSSTGGVSVPTVLSYDTLNGVAASTSTVTISLVATPHPGIVLNTTTGAVSVTAGTPPGYYELKYKICEKTLIDCTCDEDIAKVTVGNIDAVNDNFTASPIDFSLGGTTVSVLANDILNGATPVYTNVTLTLTNNGGIAGATINAQGVITIPAGTAPGTYTLQYNMCQKPGTLNCDSASVTVTVVSYLGSSLRANAIVKQVRMQSTGKIILGGEFSKYDNVNNMRLVRANQDLTLDTSFAQTGQLSATGNNLVNVLDEIQIQSDDRILIGGHLDLYNGSPVKRLFRLYPNGGLDPSFNPGGAGPVATDPTDGSNEATVQSIAILQDGTMVAVGNFDQYNGVTVNDIVGLKADGTINPVFNVGTGSGGVYGGTNIAKVHQGKIIIGSALYYYKGASVGNVIRVLPNGNLDTTFAQGNLIMYTYPSMKFQVWDIAIQSDDKVILGGTFQGYNGVTSKNLVRLMPDGTVDTTFNIGTGFNSNLTDGAFGSVMSVTIQADGKIMVGGTFNSFNGYPVNNLVRLNSDGSYDPTFSYGTGVEGYTATQLIVYDLLSQPNGKVLIGGNFTHFSGIYAGHITRIAPSTGIQGRGIDYYETEPAIEAANIAMGDIFTFSNKDITVYPNPSTGILNIDVKGYEGQSFELVIHNALGQLVYKGTVTNTLNQLDITNLENGNYFVTLQNNTATINKIIIKK